MKKCVLRNLLISGLVGVCVILGGCGNSFNYDIPNDAIAITDTDDNIYSNPNDSMDTYGYVEIDGVNIDIPDFIDSLGYEIWQ